MNQPNLVTSQLLQHRDIRKVYLGAQSWSAGVAAALDVIDHRRSFAKLSLCKIVFDDDAHVIPRFPLRTQQGTSFVVGTPKATTHDVARDKWIVPPEFSLTSRHESNYDQHQNLMIALEAHSVAVERIWLAECREASKLSQGLLKVKTPKRNGYLEHDLSVGIAHNRLAATSVGREPRVSNVFLSADLVKDAYALPGLVPPPDFAVGFGMIGSYSVAGTEVCLYSDAGRDPEHMVLPAQTLIIVGDALYHGAYSQRPARISSQGGGFTISRTVAQAITDCTSVTIVD